MHFEPYKLELKMKLVHDELRHEEFNIWISYKLDIDTQLFLVKKMEMPKLCKLNLVLHIKQSLDTININCLKIRVYYL